MIGAAVEHALNIGDLALQNFDFLPVQIDVADCNLRIGFQRLQKLPEPGQIDIEGCLDHGPILIPSIRTQSGYPLTNALKRFLLWMTRGTEPGTGQAAEPRTMALPLALDTAGGINSA